MAGLAKHWLNKTSPRRILGPVTTTIIKGEAPVGITYIKYIKQYKGPVDYVVMDKYLTDPNYMSLGVQGLPSKRGEALS